MLRSLVLSCAVVALAACGSKTFPSVCTEQPPPSACSQTCMSGGSNTCPDGFHCNSNGNCDAECLAGGSQCGSGYVCTPTGTCESTSDCTDLTCQVADCSGSAMPTTITGIVYAPNGTLPLYGINVYVPDQIPDPFPAGLLCDQCNSTLPGNPVGQPVTSGDDGSFELTNVPSGSNIPLVISSGKWRRIIKIPSVASCAKTAVTAADTTLPKSSTDLSPNTIATNGISMPKIAISTGSADALECLIRKLGIADSEIGTQGGTGHVSLFADTQSGGEGTSSFMGGFAGGNGMFADSEADLWGNTANMNDYDIVMNSCEGGQYSNTKSQTDMNNLKAYADAGGRVFLSHWHNIWIEGATTPPAAQAPMVWTSIATWNNSAEAFDTPPDTIDEMNNPKGSDFAQWMLDVMGSTMRDQIVIGDGPGGPTGKVTCTTVDETKGEQWVYWTGESTTQPNTQNFQFTTPNEDPPNQRCGKVVFSDMHVSGDSSSDPGTPYPMGCAASDLTPQEKAIAFMFFDIASCVATTIQ
jgi:hypothetical protein